MEARAVDMPAAEADNLVAVVDTPVAFADNQAAFAVLDSRVEQVDILVAGDNQVPVACQDIVRPAADQAAFLVA